MARPEAEPYSAENPTTASRSPSPFRGGKDGRLVREAEPYTLRIPNSAFRIPNYELCIMNYKFLPPILPLFP